MEYGLYLVFLCFFVLITLPIQFVIASAIVIFSGLPILFRQKRVGKDGNIFTIYKFRTMRGGAHDDQSGLRPRNEADGPVFKIYNDPRYTQVGKFLAHTGLDELPQLWNVIIGDMAIFGPRPLPVAEGNKLKSWQKERQRIKPGIISPAILTGRYHENFDAWMKSDIAYVKDKSIVYDVQLAAKSLTFLVSLVFRTIVNY